MVPAGSGGARTIIDLAPVSDDASEDARHGLLGDIREAGPAVELPAVLLTRMPNVVPVVFTDWPFSVVSCEAWLPLGTGPRTDVPVIGQFTPVKRAGSTSETPSCVGRFVRRETGAVVSVSVVRL